MGFFDAGFQALSASKSNKRTKHNYKKRYQWQVEDLRKAGLNPALAYGQSPGSGPTAPMAGSANIGGNIEGTVSNVLQSIRQKKELEVMDTSAKLNKGLALKATADAAHSVASTREINVSAFLKSLGIAEATNAMQVEQEWGPTAHKISRGTKMLGNVLGNFGFLFGGGSTSKPKGTAKPFKSKAPKAKRGAKTPRKDGY